GMRHPATPTFAMTMRRISESSGRGTRRTSRRRRDLAVSVLAFLLLSGIPSRAHAQVFIASHPEPDFTIGPLFVSASVGRQNLGRSPSSLIVSVSWSLTQLSETRSNTEVFRLPLLASEGLVPQVLKVQFAYFAGRLAWRPILISVLFLGLGNLTGPLVNALARRLGRTLRARIHVGRG